jgi:hypothetical protein
LLKLSYKQKKTRISKFYLNRVPERKDKGERERGPWKEGKGKGVRARGKEKGRERMRKRLM